MLWLQLRKLNSEDGAVRTKAAHVLAERGNSRAVEPLGRALADRDWDDRAAAAIALGKLGNGRGVAFLVDGLAADPDVDVRCGCAWALGRIGGQSVFEPLGAALGDEDEAVRRVATEALAKVGTAAALEGLGRALDDPHHDVRLAAVNGLGKIGSGRSAPRLLAALEDSEWSVRSAAAEGLSKLDDSTAVPALLGALARGEPAALLVAAEALGNIGDPAAVEPLVEAIGGGVAERLAEHDVRLRRSVATALGDIGKAEGLPALLRLLSDRFSAGVAFEAIAKVLHWDAGRADGRDLQVLARHPGAEQVPWMVDEAEESRTGRVVVREGKPWFVDAAEVRAAALAELRRRGNDLGDPGVLETDDGRNA
jgi:HEAT repeat protein